jgi:hypothetical protein
MISPESLLYFILPNVCGTIGLYATIAVQLLRSKNNLRLSIKQIRQTATLLFGVLVESAKRYEHQRMLCGHLWLASM